MSTIPLRSSGYTVVGSLSDLPETEPGPGAVSLLLLGQGGKFQRAEAFEKLFRMGWGEVVSVESSNPSYDLETLSQRFHGLRFVVFSNQNLSPGERINAAIRECRSDLVFVLWSSMNPMPLSARAVEEMFRGDSVVTAPLIRNARGEVFPSVAVPAHYQKGVRTLFVAPGPENSRTIYPFDYTGIYRRDLFISLEGYDPAIREPYWQKMDFGFRAYLWGSQIAVLPSFRVQLQGEFEAEDTSGGPGLLRFYLKNLAVEHKADHGELEAGAFWEFLRKSGMNIFAARSLFKEIRSWVAKNRFRFKVDARQIVEMWDEEKYS